MGIIKDKEINKLVMPNVYVPGTFDLWHVGHIRLFKYARDSFYYPNIIAGISTDRLVKKYKLIYPIYPFKERWETVLACKYVNQAIVQNKFFDINQLKKYSIHYVLLGNDWKDKSFPELEKAQLKLGFKIIYKPYTRETSSSEIKKRIIKNSYEIIQSQLKRKHDK